MLFATLVGRCLNFVWLTCQNYEIDESHGMMHAMGVLQLSQKILQSELDKNPSLIDLKRVITTASLLHDTIDGKYVDPVVGMKALDTFLQSECSDLLTKEEMDISKTIMKTMSYSVVKKQGYPSLGAYQSAYHIVREADLLSAYDLNRSTMFALARNRLEGKDVAFEDVFKETHDLLFSRMATYIEDDLFVHAWSKQEANRLYLESIEQLKLWKNILYEE
jgi:HD superfamily phosphodiesterase